MILCEYFTAVFEITMQVDISGVGTVTRDRIQDYIGHETEAGSDSDADCGVTVRTNTVAEKPKPPSKRNTPCGYSGCKFNGVNLKRHMQRVHPKKPAHIRGSGFEPNGRFNHWIAPSQPQMEVSYIWCANM